MNNLQIDILNVLNYSDYLEPKEIAARLKVECDRDVTSLRIIPQLHSLRDRKWLESEVVGAREFGGASYRIWGYRKVKNGRRIPDKRTFTTQRMMSGYRSVSFAKRTH